VGYVDGRSRSRRRDASAARPQAGARSRELGHTPGQAGRGVGHNSLLFPISILFKSIQRMRPHIIRMQH
jgi:hypothetical protein